MQSQDYYKYFIPNYSNINYFFQIDDLDQLSVSLSNTLTN